MQAYQDTDPRWTRALSALIETTPAAKTGTILRTRSLLASYLRTVPSPERKRQCRHWIYWIGYPLSDAQLRNATYR